MNKLDNYTHVIHELPPIISKNSRILILGSFPSVKSREHNFYYMHPQNRFWKILSLVVNEDLVSKSIDERRNYLLNNNVALYDVIYECDIVGSSDLKIKNVIPTNIEELIKETKITHIFVNGNKAYELFVKYNNLNVIKLPSTSPANAAYNLDKLYNEWEIIRDYLQ